MVATSKDIDIKITRRAREIANRALATLCLLRLNGTLPLPDDALDDEITKAAIDDLKTARLAHERGRFEASAHHHLLHGALLQRIACAPFAPAR